MFFIDRLKGNGNVAAAEEEAVTLRVTIRRKRNMDLHQSVLQRRRETSGANTPARQVRLDLEDQEGIADSTPDLVAIHTL